MSEKKIRLIECPRDAMQGWKTFVPTEKKIEYLQSLLKVGFDTIDFGSFVSPKAIPQMADTKEVVGRLSEELRNPSEKAVERHQHTSLPPQQNAALPGGDNASLLAIVANLRGAEEASVHDIIKYLGYPFSVSETFQQRNTNASIAQSLDRVEEIQELCMKTGKELVIYISMAFGNPYSDAYSEEMVFEWVNKLVGMDIGIISLADTVGVASPEQVYDITHYLVESLPGTEIGVHLHSTPENWREKLDAAVRAGCYRFDGALKGIGGCPMADDELVGNMNTEWMIDYFKEKNLLPPLNKNALAESLRLASEIFV